MKLLLLVALMCFSNWNFASGDNYISAQKIEDSTYSAPRSVRRYGLEGWLYYRYTIDETGKVHSVQILDSSGSEEFNRSFKSYLSSLRYKPATLNGKPVSQDVGPHPFVLYFNMPRAAAPSFTKHYERGLEAASKGGTTKIEESIQDIKSLPRRNIYEDVHLAYLEAVYFQAVGDVDEEEDKLLWIHRLDSRYRDLGNLSESERVYLYSRLYQISMSGMFIADAYKFARNLEEVAPEHPTTLKIAGHANNVKAKVTDDKSIRISTKLYANRFSDGGVVGFNLLRNHVEITNVSGIIDTVEFRCKNGIKKLPFKNDSTWAVPESWGRCFIQLEGEANTSFDLIELAKGQ